MSGGASTVTVDVDPLNYPAARGGKPRARLWFLMMNSTALDAAGAEEKKRLLGMARELERRVDAGAATGAEREVFEQAYAAFRSGGGA